MSMTFPFPSQKIYRHWNHKGAQETTRPDRAASTSWSRCLHFLFFMFSRNGKSPMAVYFWVQLSFLSWNFLLWRNQFPKLRDIVSKRLFLVIILKHMVWMMKGKKKSNIWYVRQAEYFSWRISKWPSIWPNCRRPHEQTQRTSEFWKLCHFMDA